MLATQLSLVDGLDLSNVLTRDDNLSNLQIQELESRGIRVDQEVSVFRRKFSTLSGQVSGITGNGPTRN